MECLIILPVVSRLWETLWRLNQAKTWCWSEKYGYINSCPTNLGTGMRASVHIDLPGWTKLGVPVLQARCEELHLQPRGTRGESGGHLQQAQTGGISRSSWYRRWLMGSTCSTRRAWLFARLTAFSLFSMTHWCSPLSYLKSAGGIGRTLLPERFVTL